MDDLVKVFAEYKSPRGEEKHPIQSKLKEEVLDCWTIINFKGLSPFIYQSIFAVAKLYSPLSFSSSVFCLRRVEITTLILLLFV